MSLQLIKILTEDWTLARGNLREDLDRIELAINTMGSVGGSTPPPPPGTIIIHETSPGPRPTIWLGGSGSESVYAADSVTWIPATAHSATRATIDTVLRGSTAGTMRVRVRAESGNVTVRLQNVTNGVQVGISVPVPADAIYTTVEFPVLLTAGSREYEVQFLSSTGNAVLSLGSAHLE